MPGFKKIGLLWPADGRNDREFWNWLPASVSVLIVRYDVDGRLGVEQIESDGDINRIAAAARLLRHVNPDLIALGDCAAGFIGGKDFECAQMDAASSSCNGIPVISMSSSIVDALKFAGARRVAILSPYSSGVTERFESYLRDSGFSLSSGKCISAGSESLIERISSERWIEEADAAEADALVVPGGGVSLSTLIARLEKRIGKPVVCGPGALMWKALRTLGREPSSDRLGFLFSAGSGSALKSMDADARQILSTASKVFALSQEPPQFASGKGAWLFDERGKRYLDFACGSGVASLGYGHPAVVSGVRRQLDSGLTHLGPHFVNSVQVEYYHLLREILPPQLSRMHPATNGTEATESALKAAMHFTGRKNFISFIGGYHGRTLGSLAVSSARGSNRILGKLSPEVRFLELGCDEMEIRNFMDKRPRPAGAVVEAVQATNGVIFPPRGWLRRLAELAEHYGVPLIIDEVFTGFGRTGTFFAIEQEQLVPDLLVLGKCLGGGFPAGLIAGRDEIMSAWPIGSQSSTFQFNPISAAAAKASLEVMIAEDSPAAARNIERILREQLVELREFPFVADIRGRGAMFGIEIATRDGKPDRKRCKSIRSAALDRGLITWECGSDGHVIGLIPPFVVDEGQIALCAGILRECFSLNSH